MIARLRPVLSSCEGLTALETAVVLFITAIVAVPLLAVAGWVVTLPVEWQANVEAARDAREILRQVADDARQAEAVVSNTFGPEDDTDTFSKCWRFTWMDYTDERFFEVSYYYRENGPVVREETISQIEEDVTAETCELAEALPIPEEKKIIESVEYFEIDFTPIWNGGAFKCLVRAEVRLSRPENARPLRQEIAAMMRPDNADCQQLP